jgi:hypothetical protein
MLTIVLAVPATASPRLSLSILLHSQQLPLTVLNPPESTSSYLLFIWNFTIDLTSRDPGSTLVHISVVNPTNLAGILSDANLTSLLALRPTLCQISCPPVENGIIQLGYDTLAAVPIPTGSLGSLEFRPLATGVYHIVFYSDSTIVYVHQISGYQTWTTTTVG